MRIFFMGSVAGHKDGANQAIKDKDHEMFAAAKELGYTAAFRRHTVLLGSDSPRAIDYYIAQGIFECCEAHPEAQFEMEIHCPEGGAVPYATHPKNLKVTSKTYPGDEGEKRWIITHIEMMKSCDALITLGGGENTKLVGLLAVEHPKSRPYLIPIAAFGGASVELYNRIRPIYTQMEGIPDKSALTCLNAHWSKDNAERIIGLIEAFVSSELTRRPPGHYFISYSSKDTAVADEIELFLRRNKRQVLRDVANISEGDSISIAVETMIHQSDVFMAIVSSNYMASDWCRGELTYAMNRKRAGKTPQTLIVMVIEENVNPPISTADILQRRAYDRTHRENALWKIMSDEDVADSS